MKIFEPRILTDDPIIIDYGHYHPIFSPDDLILYFPYGGIFTSPYSYTDEQLSKLSKVVHNFSVTQNKFFSANVDGSLSIFDAPQGYDYFDVHTSFTTDGRIALCFMPQNDGSLPRLMRLYNWDEGIKENTFQDVYYSVVTDNSNFFDDKTLDTYWVSDGFFAMGYAVDSDGNPLDNSMVVAKFDKQGNKLFDFTITLNITEDSQWWYNKQITLEFILGNNADKLYLIETKRDIKKDYSQTILHFYLHTRNLDGTFVNEIPLNYSGEVTAELYQKIGNKIYIFINPADSSQSAFLKVFSTDTLSIEDTYYFPWENIENAIILNLNRKGLYLVVGKYIPELSSSSVDILKFYYLKIGADTDFQDAGENAIYTLPANGNGFGYLNSTSMFFVYWKAGKVSDFLKGNSDYQDSNFDTTGIGTFEDYKIKRMMTFNQFIQNFIRR